MKGQDSTPALSPIFTVFTIESDLGHNKSV